MANDAMTTPGESTPGESTPGESTPGESTPGESTPGESISRVPAAPTIPPHQATPVLTGLTDDEFDAMYGAIDHGFHEQHPPEHRQRQRIASDPARFFGYQVQRRWVATFGSFERTLTVPGGGSIPIAAVTNVTVHSAYRRRGLMRSMMTEELDRTRARGELAATLYASEAGIYGRFGYGNATPVASLTARTDALVFRQEITGLLADAGGSVDEVPVDEYLAHAGPLHDRLLTNRPGGLSRPTEWWSLRTHDSAALRGGATPLRFVLSFDADGRVDGHASYRVKGDWQLETLVADLTIEEIEADTTAAAARLWRYLLQIDLVQTISVPRTPVDHVLQHFVTDSRALTTRHADGIYVRLVDVAAALTARRYAAPLDTVIEVRDAMLPGNAGRYQLTGDREAATIEPSDHDPDITLDVRELGAVYLGGVSLAALHAAGLVSEHRVGAVAEASAAFAWPVAPFCTDSF